MKNMLLISGLQIFPTESGGQLRSANICQALVKQGFSVKIYSFTGRRKNYLKLKNSMNNNIHKNLNEFINQNIIFGLIQFLFYKFSLPPFWLTLLTKYTIPKELSRLIESHDNIMIDFPYLHNISSHTSKPILLNTHNVEHELFLNRPKISNIIRNIEIEAIKKSRHVFSCNRNDIETLKNQSTTLDNKFSLLPNAIDLNKFINIKSQRDLIRNSLNISGKIKVFLFTGSQYAPNIEAYEFLKRFSNINKNQMLHNNILILIVGTVAETKIDEMHFKVIGKVENITNYFAASDFGINPIQIGSGTNVKMIEFISAKLPILTTIFGARGLCLKDKESCHIFARENLLNIMLEAIQSKSTKNIKMAGTAFEINHESIDMSAAINSLTKHCY